MTPSTSPFAGAAAAAAIAAAAANAAANAAPAATARATATAAVPRLTRHISSPRRLGAAVLFACAPLVHAQAITDPAHDFLPTFAGSAASADIDVVSAFVTYNASTDLFTLSGTMDGAIGATPSGFYVWGVNRGAGAAGFAANGLPGVLFDRVVLVRPNGTASIGGGAALPGGSVTISGNTISAVVSGALLPSTGFAKSAYTSNLWPRDGRYTGFAAISDFAPDNSNLVTTAVPEPGSYALLLGGLGVLGFVARRRARKGARG